jgi:hypothetical protein
MPDQTIEPHHPWPHLEPGAHHPCSLIPCSLSLSQGEEGYGLDGLMGYDERYDEGYDDDDDDDPSRLSPHEVEQLVEKYLHTRKRADELETENAKLTKQLMAMGQSPSCQDTVSTCTLNPVTLTLTNTRAKAR